MKSRDRVIALVIVAVVVAAIWWIGVSLREQSSTLGADVAAPDSVSGEMDSLAAVEAGVAAAADASTGADAGGTSAACRALDEASRKVLDEARKTRPCTPDPDMSSLGCHTTGKGTWGFRVDEAFEGAMPMPGDKCGDTGYLVRLVHVDQSGVEESIIVGVSLSSSSSALRPYTISTGYRAVRMSDARFFDWDGDGEDEVFVRTTLGTYDQIERQESNIFSFHGEMGGDAGRVDAGDGGATHIVPYPQAASLVIDTTRDVDGDGRPDLLVSLGGAFGATAPPVGVRLVAHSLPDGTFSMRDAAAVAWAQTQCPKDPQLDLSTKTASDFGQKLADDMACALLWAHDKDLAAGLAKACPRTETGLSLWVDAGACPAWTKRLVGTRPPILLR